MQWMPVVAYECSSKAAIQVPLDLKRKICTCDPQSDKGLIGKTTLFFCHATPTWKSGNADGLKSNELICIPSKVWSWY
jgi:hypothetical protein